jgi:hypothetical protein
LLEIEPQCFLDDRRACRRAAFFLGLIDKSNQVPRKVGRHKNPASRPPSLSMSDKSFAGSGRVQATHVLQATTKSLILQGIAVKPLKAWDFT